MTADTANGEGQRGRSWRRFLGRKAQVGLDVFALSGVLRPRVLPAFRVQSSDAGRPQPPRPASVCRGRAGGGAVGLRHLQPDLEVRRPRGAAEVRRSGGGGFGTSPPRPLLPSGGSAGLQGPGLGHADDGDPGVRGRPRPARPPASGLRTVREGRDGPGKEPRAKEARSSRRRGAGGRPGGAGDLRAWGRRDRGEGVRRRRPAEARVGHPRREGARDVGGHPPACSGAGDRPRRHHDREGVAGRDPPDRRDLRPGAGEGADHPGPLRHPPGAGRH